MSKPKNNKKKWTKSDVQTLKDMAKKDKPTTDIAKKLGRTEASIRTKASEQSISLNRPN